MVRLEDAVVARLETHGHRFEILIDPHSADRIRSGEINVDDDLAIDQVFKDARKGDKASESAIVEIFGTRDISAIAIEIVKKGQIQLTTEQRRALLEERRNQIVEMIARESINPQTKAPNPPARIAQAIEEAKFHIDPFKSAEDQLPGVLKAIRPILPIKMEKVRIKIRIPGDRYGKVYADLMKNAEVLREEWGRDGSWNAVLQVPAGISNEIIETIGRKVGDSAEVSIIRQ